MSVKSDPFRFVLLAFAVLLTQFSCGQPHSDGNVAASANRVAPAQQDANKPPLHATKEEIEDLIRHLRSGEKPPRAFPNYSDIKNWEPVQNCFHKLREIGIPAFPYVIEHLDDADFSFVAEGPTGTFNCSVGDACRLVLDCNLRPFGIFSFQSGQYVGESRRRRPSYCDHYHLLDKKSAQEWWASRKNESLHDLQMEVVQWTINEEEINRADYSDEERAYLQSFVDKLVASDSPLPAFWPFAK